MGGFGAESIDLPSDLLADKPKLLPLRFSSGYRFQEVVTMFPEPYFLLREVHLLEVVDQLLFKPVGVGPCRTIVRKKLIQCFLQVVADQLLAFFIQWFNSVKKGKYVVHTRHHVVLQYLSFQLPELLHLSQSLFQLRKDQLPLIRINLFTIRLEDIWHPHYHRKQSFRILFPELPLKLF